MNGSNMRTKVQTSSTPQQNYPPPPHHPTTNNITHHHNKNVVCVTQGIKFCDSGFFDKVFIKPHLFFGDDIVNLLD